MKELWQTIAGRDLARRAARCLHRGQTVILLFPDGQSDGARQAIEEELKSSEGLWETELELSKLPSETIPLAFLSDRWNLSDAGRSIVRDVYELAERIKSLRRTSYLVWLLDVGKANWKIWKDFIEKFADAMRRQAPEDRNMFCIILAGDVCLDIPAHDETLAILTLEPGWLDIRLLAEFLEQTRRKELREHPLQRLLALEIVAHLAMFDARLAAELIVHSLETLCEPFTLLEREAHARDWAPERLRHLTRDERLWLGVDQRLENRIFEHSCAMAALDKRDAIKRRVWRSQLSVLMPILEELRINLVEDLRLKKKLKGPFETCYGQKESVEELDAGELVHFIRAREICVDRQGWTLLQSVRDMRNSLAHANAVPASMIRDPLLLDRYDALLESG